MVGLVGARNEPQGCMVISMLPAREFRAVVADCFRLFRAARRQAVDRRYVVLSVRGIVRLVWFAHVISCAKIRNIKSIVEVWRRWCVDGDRGHLACRLRCAPWQREP